MMLIFYILCAYLAVCVGNKLFTNNKLLPFTNYDEYKRITISGETVGAWRSLTVGDGDTMVGIRSNGKTLMKVTLASTVPQNYLTQLRFQAGEMRQIIRVQMDVGGVSAAYVLVTDDCIYLIQTTPYKLYIYMGSCESESISEIPTVHPHQLRLAAQLTGRINRGDSRTDISVVAYDNKTLYIRPEGVNLFVKVAMEAGTMTFASFRVPRITVGSRGYKVDTNFTIEHMVARKGFLFFTTAGKTNEWLFKFATKDLYINGLSTRKTGYPLTRNIPRGSVRGMVPWLFQTVLLLTYKDNKFGLHSVDGSKNINVLRLGFPRHLYRDTTGNFSSLAIHTGGDRHVLFFPMIHHIVNTSFGRLMNLDPDVSLNSPKIYAFSTYLRWKIDGQFIKHTVLLICAFSGCITSRWNPNVQGQFNLFSKTLVPPYAKDRQDRGQLNISAYNVAVYGTFTSNRSRTELVREPFSNVPPRRLEARHESLHWLIDPEGYAEVPRELQIVCTGSVACPPNLNQLNYLLDGRLGTWTDFYDAGGSRRNSQRRAFRLNLLREGFEAGTEYQIGITIFTKNYHRTFKNLITVKPIKYLEKFQVTITSPTKFTVILTMNPDVPVNDRPMLFYFQPIAAIATHCNFNTSNVFIKDMEILPEVEHFKQGKPRLSILRLYHDQTGNRLAQVKYFYIEKGIGAIEVDSRSSTFTLAPSTAPSTIIRVTTSPVLSTTITEKIVEEESKLAILLAVLFMALLLIAAIVNGILYILGKLCFKRRRHRKGKSVQKTGMSGRIRNVEEKIYYPQLLECAVDDSQVPIYGRAIGVLDDDEEQVKVKGKKLKSTGVHVDLPKLPGPQKIQWFNTELPSGVPPPSPIKNLETVKVVAAPKVTKAHKKKKATIATIAPIPVTM